MGKYDSIIEFYTDNMFIICGTGLPDNLTSVIQDPSWILFIFSKLRAKYLEEKQCKWHSRFTNNFWNATIALIIYGKPYILSLAAFNKQV